MFQTDSGFKSENKQKKLLIVRQNDIFFEVFLCLQLGSVPGRGGRPQSPQGALEPVRVVNTKKLQKICHFAVLLTAFFVYFQT